jgi:hypothetical protein
VPTLYLAGEAGSTGGRSGRSAAATGTPRHGGLPKKADIGMTGILQVSDIPGNISMTVSRHFLPFGGSAKVRAHSFSF